MAGVQIKANKKKTTGIRGQAAGSSSGSEDRRCVPSVWSAGRRAAKASLEGEGEERTADSCPRVRRAESGSAQGRGGRRLASFSAYQGPPLHCG